MNIEELKELEKLEELEEYMEELEKKFGMIGGEHCIFCNKVRNGELNEQRQDLIFQKWIKNE